MKESMPSSVHPPQAAQKPRTWFRDREEDEAPEDSLDPLLARLAIGGRTISRKWRPMSSETALARNNRSSAFRRLPELRRAYRACGPRRYLAEWAGQGILPRPCRRERYS